MKVRKMSKNKKKRSGFPKQGWKASLIKHMPSCKYNLSKSFTSLKLFGLFHIFYQMKG